MHPRRVSRILRLLASCLSVGLCAPTIPLNQAAEGKPDLVRIAAAQPKARLVEYQLDDSSRVLASVEQNLTELETMIGRAAAAKCDAIALPEDTLGLGKWEAAHPDAAKTLLPAAVDRMLVRLGRAATAHQIYVVCCSDTATPNGRLHNTAFLIGRDGRMLGRYDKVNMPIHELNKERGTAFPVFKTPDLGDVGMLICYDMVFPEAARALALGGADIIFHPTLGGAAIGDDDISRAAFRTRAVENFVYLVVAQRGSGSMIISPQGKILAQANGSDELAIAEINPRAGREGGDAMNFQADMRSRLFRERSPAAFGILTDPSPPVLAKVPETITPEEAVSISERALTLGEDQFRQASQWAREGKTNEAVTAFQRLRREYRQSWIDRVSAERLAALGVTVENDRPAGLAARYPGDRGLERDPNVLFAENFEAGTVAEIGKRWGEISNQDGQVIALADDVPPGSLGKRSLQMTATLGLNTGGHLYTRFKPGADRVFARFYVKFPDEAAYIHHFVTLGGYRPATSWPQGGAGVRPRGDERFTVGIEPYGNYGQFPAPGAWNFYAYWPEMKGSANGKFWGNSLTPVKPAVIPHNRWQCVEVMLQCNSATNKSDGELALWLDGQPVAHFKPGVPRSRWTGMGFSLTDPGGEPFEGFRWRTNEALNVNFFWLMHYVTENAARQNHLAQPNPVNRVRFDDIVISTEYVGPIAPGR